VLRVFVVLCFDGCFATGAVVEVRGSFGRCFVTETGGVFSRREVRARSWTWRVSMDRASFGCVGRWHWSDVKFAVDQKT
jgi:hypothetical protein